MCRALKNRSQFFSSSLISLILFNSWFHFPYYLHESITIYLIITDIPDDSRLQSTEPKPNAYRYNTIKKEREFRKKWCQKQRPKWRSFTLKFLPWNKRIAKLFNDNRFLRGESCKVSTKLAILKELNQIKMMDAVVGRFFFLLVFLLCTYPIIMLWKITLLCSPNGYVRCEKFGCKCEI